MKGLLIALGVMAVMAVAIGALLLEVRLAQQKHQARFVLCWLAWVVTASVAGLVLGLAGAGVWEAASGGAVAGFIGYPAIRLRFAANNWQYDAAQERLEDLERMKYRAVDFGGVASPAAASAPKAAIATSALSARPPPDAAPLTRLPVNAALADVVADRRPLWARAAEQGMVALVCVAGLVLWLAAVVFDSDGYRSDAGAPEAVAEVLEMNGFAAPKVKRQFLATHCYQSFAYRWSGMGAEGRACVNYYDGEIEVKVDRSWGPLPAPFEVPPQPPPQE